MTEKTGLEHKKEKFICFECFRNNGIKKFIKEVKKLGNCNFCPQDNIYIRGFQEVVEYIIQCIKHEYEEHPNGMFNIKDVLNDKNFKCSTYPYTEIIKALLESSYSLKSETNFKDNPIETQKLIVIWDRFKETIKKQNRFFIKNYSLSYNSLGEEYFPSVILDRIIECLRENECISEIKEGDYIFRARSFFEAKEYNAKNLGYPTEAYRYSTRMSPLGIPAFYASTEQDVAVNEVRQSVGQPAKKFIVGCWVFNKDINVVDFTKIPKREIDFFDLKLQKKKDEADFLKEFSKTVSEPIRKDKQEHIEYIPTQALSEFIKMSFKDIYGIAYSSNTNTSNSKNLCLFPERITFVDEFSHSEDITECMLKKYVTYKVN